MISLARRLSALGGAVLFGLCMVGHAHADEIGTGETPKIADAVYVTLPPKIDGKLDDEAWQQATVIEDLHQTNPNYGAAPTERTIFYVAYDRDALYIAARVYESDPSRIVANQLIQGGSIRNDDRINLVLDPYLTKRSGYVFGINPNGIRGEGLYDRPYQVNPDWSGIWYGEARRTDYGWVAELAIPFKTISFNSNLNEWGFSLTRTIMRSGEKIAWTSRNRETNPSAAGIIAGIGEAQQGMGLDIVPSLALKSVKENHKGHEHWTMVPSVNAFYKITPSLTASVTANTDFSGADVDDVVVNLSRFSLFLPEKRDFFLQDADIFGFADVEENGIPFFSRKIGLSEDGLPVDIVVGAKLSGRIGNVNIGAMGVLQDNQPTVDQTELAIARISVNVLEESAIGVIGTFGDPQSDDDNYLMGADFVYRNNSLIKGKNIEGSLWYQTTSTETLDTGAFPLTDRTYTGASYGGSIGMYAKDGFFGAIYHKTLEDGFNPALGFANWTGIRQTENFGGYRRRPDSSWIREITHSYFYQRTTDLDGNLEMRIRSIQPFEIVTNAGDKARLRLRMIDEVIHQPFEIYDGIFVQPGHYDHNRAELVLTSSEARRFSYLGEFDVGDFFDGYRKRVFNSVTWRPNKHLLFGAGLGVNDIDLVGGDFVTRVGTFRANIAFNSKWSWLNFIQYDNVSDTAGYNGRLKWQPVPGDEYVFVVNYGADIGEDAQIYTSNSELILKASRTIRF